MLVREKKKAPRHKMPTGQRPMRVPSEPYPIPAPINGWVLSENLATPMPASAKVLDHFIVTTSGSDVRGGHQLHATLDDPVTHLAQFTGATEALFACTASKIFDVTSPADPEVTPTASVTGQTGGDYATAMFNIVGTDYLYFVNGADSARLYNGSTFTTITTVSSPAITNVATASLSHVAVYAERLFFVEKDSLRAWYLPIASIAGAAASFSLAGVFRKGGKLLFISSFSGDSGEGMDDRIVFVSTEGEAAIYQGTNPGDAATWSLMGVYDIPKPLGKNSHIRTGGDLLIGTEAGIIPLTSAIQQDIAAVAGAAVSKNIAPYWQQKATRIGSDWDMVKVLDDNLLIVAQPNESLDTSLAVNLQTGAWMRWTGIRTQCLGVLDGDPYCGDHNGLVYRMNAGGSDNGALYTARYLGNFDPMGAQGVTKTIVNARPLFEASTDFIPQLIFKANFDETASAPPSTAPVASAEGWDTGNWDEVLWDGGAIVTRTVSDWQSQGATGVYLAPELQISSNSTTKPDVSLVSIDAMFHIGEMVT